MILKYGNIFLFVLLFFFEIAFSQMIKLGPEFLINGSIQNNQREPFVTADCNGNYVVVWTTDFADENMEDIYFKKFSGNFDAVKPSEKVNDFFPNTQYRPAVAANCKGNFVITWVSYEGEDTGFDIITQIFDKWGQKISGEIFVNSTRIYTQNNPAIVIDTDGSFIIVWHSWTYNENDRDIFGQKFDSNGEKIGDEFLVNTYRKNSQAKPSIALLKDGNFVVCWESWKQDDTTKSDYGVYAQLFDRKCNKKGAEFRVNTYINNDQFYSNVSANKDGNFIIVWTSWEQDGDKGGIYGQRFFSDGRKNGSEFRINTYVKNYQWLPKAVYFDNGSFAVVWSSWNQDGNRDGVILQLFDKSGNKKGNEIVVNNFKLNYQWEPSVAKLSEKSLVIVWSSYGQKKINYDIYGRQIFIP